MLISIPEVLSKADVAAFRAQLDNAPWVDGNATAGAQSALVKDNEQLPEDSALAQEFGGRVLDALGASATFISAALPAKIFPPLFNRYATGRSFGLHVDNAIRGIRGLPVRVRTDLSATLFLSEPEEYDGGELEIEHGYGAETVKLAAGDLVLYPATSLHKVNPVLRGARIASFFWVQSMVRSDDARTTLFDLDQTIQTLASTLGVDNAEVVRLSGVYQNLMRMWAEV